MASDRRSLMVIGCTLALLLVGLAFLSWPNYRQARTIQRDIASLRTQIAGIDRRSDELEALAAELAETRHDVSNDLKYITDTADVAGLIRRLSLPVDGIRVIDQTFTAGRASSFDGVEDGSIGVLPLTVDMVSDFDSINATMEAIESINRLIRFNSLNLMRDEEHDSLVKATIGIDAIFEQFPGEQEH